MCNDILIILYVGLLNINWYQGICCFDVGKVAILLNYFMQGKRIILFGAQVKRMMAIKISQGSFVSFQEILDLS